MRLTSWIALLTLCLASASAWAVDRTNGSANSEFAGTVERIRSGADEHRLVLLGETHGTRETPDLIATLATAYASDGPVLLGVEIPRSEHAALSRYLASDGGEAARVALRATPFWTVIGDQHDGRRSEDMLDLIEVMRGLRRDGRDVALLAYDLDTDFTVSMAMPAI